MPLLVQGLLCWSNVILWPENINKLIALRLDNYQDVPSIEVSRPWAGEVLQPMYWAPQCRALAHQEG